MKAAGSKNGGRHNLVTAAAFDNSDNEENEQKPARERDPDDYLSLSRSEPGRLTGSSGRLEMCLSHSGSL